jgi:cytochrome c biogenesis protein CcmG/thiol:disulfide interchange protein DsbE
VTGTGRRAQRASAAAVLLTTACGGAGGAGDLGSGITSRPDDAELPPTSPCPEPLQDGGGAGAQLTDVTLPCLGQSTELALRELPAMPVVLTFWASWCGICREEMPEMQRVADEAGDQVLFLGVDVKDGQRQARFLLDDLDVTWPNLYDESGRSLDLLPSPGVPTTLVVAPDGEILDTVVGAMDQERLRELLTDRLGVRLDGAAAASD